MFQNKTYIKLEVRDQLPNTIVKNKILNWLYLTEREVSIKKLGQWLEEETNGNYKVVRNYSKKY